MNEYTQAQINEHIQFVERGKPCSVLPIKKSNIEIAKELCRGYNAEFYIEEIENNDWVNFWIYKNTMMLEIIKSLPDKPEKPIDHFILGCAFGYSVESILNYINGLKAEF